MDADDACRIQTVSSAARRGIQPKLVIFDCDGVLVDTEPVSNRVMAQAITEAGLPMSADAVAGAFEGMRLADIAAAVEKELGASLPEGWVLDFEQRRAIEFKKGVEAVPGVSSALEQLTGAGIPICVASQASREKMELTLGLSGLITHFEESTLFSSRMVKRGKPHPELFLLAARSIGCDPGETVVVEDGVLGARAGRLAGMRVLGYAATGNGERLAAEGATVFQSMAELPSILSLA
jgi:HAD superfamily hydrolase (TIGR01509 family)